MRRVRLHCVAGILTGRFFHTTKSNLMISGVAAKDVGNRTNLVSYFTVALLHRTRTLFLTVPLCR